MKTKLICSLVVTILFLVTACKKDDAKPEISLDPKDAPVLMSKIVWTGQITGFGNGKRNNESVQINFFNDDNNVIKSIRSFKNYINDELVQDDHDTIKYIYDIEGRLISLIQTGDNHPHKEEYTYSEGEITRLDSYFSGSGLEYKYSRKFIYTINEDGKVLKEEKFNYDNWSEDWNKSRSYETFEWQNGNLINRLINVEISEKRAFVNNNVYENTNVIRVCDTVRYEEVKNYNNKINPYVYFARNAVFNTKNLLVSSQGVSKDGNSTSNRSISYEYGSNGFPSKSVDIFEYNSTFNENVLTETYTTEYEYTDLK